MTITELGFSNYSVKSTKICYLKIQFTISRKVLKNAFETRVNFDSNLINSIIRDPNSAADPEAYYNM